ncbi:hypothetical protein LTS08_003873 [Lithohypha guttulata]|uniref:uncharacterized protein n=1 Tax=Lithohypha guttulata TaxID=1690604 RepID=UPI002DDEF6FC|nr:hypothetical protein LTR51_001172 [Lithohypha guttulata]KAK5103070.1 hypothetical protein LTS08_003873 [Lithohypha guttulata]
MAQVDDNLRGVDLKVLTLRGNGLQGLGIISIVDELCSRIARKNNLARVPAPCELFDIISGTGIGALIAVLLGRYCLDISRCKQHYMDFAEFIEERNLSRRAHPKTLHEEDVQAFMETLIKSEDWSGTLNIPSSNQVPRCQHVLVIQRRRKYGRGHEAETFHGCVFNDLDPANQPASLQPSQSTQVAPIVAASMTHPLDSWTSVADDDVQGFQPRIAFVSAVVLSTVEEIVSTYGSATNISFIANFGPARLGQETPDVSKGLKSPVMWVAEKTSPIKSAVMWPLKATWRTLAPHESTTLHNHDLGKEHSSHEHHRKSLSLQWPIQSMINDKNSSRPASKEDRAQRARLLVENLMASESDRKMFDFYTTSSASKNEANDMTDLKGTRNDIRDIVEFLDGSGLFVDAVRQFQAL